MVVSRIKRIYFFQTLFLTLIVGGLGGWGYFSIFPHHYFSGYPLIPVFYFLIGLGNVCIMDMVNRTMPKQAAMMYLLLRAGRMILSMLLMVVFCVMVPHEATEFLLTFVLNYLIYLIYDSWFFSAVSSNRQSSNNKEEDETI